MIWTHAHAPGHGGTLLGLVIDPGQRYGDDYRELHPARDAGSQGPLDVVQMACTCGWRSERVPVPEFAEAGWGGQIVVARVWFLEQCRKQWFAHAIGTVAGQTAARAWTEADD